MSAEQTPDIADLAAEIRRAVKVRSLGPNALAILKEGGSVSLTSSEADDAAAALAPVLAAAVREAEQRAWDKGYTSGHSNAMRRMSDEPNAPTTPNPYRAGRITEPVSHEAATRSSL